MEQSAVMKSKIEIARNLNGYSFPHKLSSKEADIIIEKVKNALSDSKYEFILHRKNDLSEIELNSLIEMELIDDNFLSSQYAALLINIDKTICILINGLDHIKIQVVGNNDIKGLYEIGNEIDDILESHLEYAFDKDLGYLTTCPVNVGTGLKVTNTIHIPSIEKLKQVDDYYKIAHKIGVNFKGVYGKTKSILGSLYKISNTIMIGRSEENIIQSVESISNDLSKREYESREILKNVHKIDLEDEIFRSLAILSSARVITNSELMKCLSNVKLGIEMGYIDDVNLEKVINFMTGKQPYLKIISAYDEEDKIERASYIRREFSLANRNNK